MPFYACMLDGMCETTGPLDICKIMYGPVPGVIPCEDMGMWLMAVGELDVLIVGMPACNLISIIELSEADEDGLLGGVVSGIFMGPVMIEMGCPIFLINGMFAGSMGESMSLQNLINAPGLYDIPSQCVVTGA